MTGEEATTTPARRRYRGLRWLARVPRRLRPLAILAVFLLTLALVAWWQRRPIAEGFVDNALTERGVRARYTIDDIGLSTQRLRDVVIGDPANPDLVADWVEVETSIGFGTAEVTGLRVGQVRMRGQLVDGRLRLGEIDKLLPPPSGKPFSLPDIRVEVADARMRLDTPLGLVGLKLAGSGVLNDGFGGTLAAVSPRLVTAPDCAATRVAAVLDLRTDDAAPRVAGPVEAATVTCGGVRIADARARVDMALNDAFDRWRGDAAIRMDSVAGAPGRVRDVEGTIAFTGNEDGTTGTIDAAGGRFSLTAASGGRLAIGGRYAIGAESGFDGSIRASGVRLADAIRGRIDDLAVQGAGTPVGPLADALVRAVAAAGRSMDVVAETAFRANSEGSTVRIVRLSADSASGARMVLSGGRGIAWNGGTGQFLIDGTITVDGGGLPQARIALTQAEPGAPITGTARIAPYAAGNARIALDPVQFRAGLDGATRIATRARLSGPLGDGRIDGLSLPIVAEWNGRGRLVVNRTCAPAGFERLAIAGLVLNRAAATLCPQDGALVAIDGATVSGGARIASAQLSGTLGGTPLTLGLRDTVFRLRDRGFALANVEARLGTAERVSRLDIARLDGAVAGGTVAGSFSGGGGQIANVPLILSEASGTWSLMGGALRLGGQLAVADAATGEELRFEPLASNDVALSLIDGQVDATGTLVHPAKGIEVADIVIRHDLSAGSGQADLIVAGIPFDEDFQPNELTPVTFGVIADVVGLVEGRGQIRWNPDGVTSDGMFTTPGTSLAAAFGPVTGIRGSIRFTDLLGLESADDQVATIAEVNPGIPVRDGTVTYRLLGGNRVAVKGGVWPFAGGTMTLDPTVLDFSGEAERRMTFRIAALDAALFLQEFDFDNLSATGVFDGTLPMVFDADGGRIVGGRLKVREGGGTIAYVGEVSKEDLGFWGNIAFGALKSLEYDDLEIALDGALSGEMVTAIRFDGVSQGVGARSNFIIDRIARLPLVFNITIRAPFRQLLDSVRSYYDPTRLIERNLPALLEAQRRQETDEPAPAPAPIQPSESEDVP